MTNSPRTRKGSASRVLAVLAAMAIGIAMIPLVAGTALADHRDPARFDQIVNLADADSNVEAAVYWSQETRRDGSGNETSDNALIGRDDNFADSLSSGGVQCAVGGPLLLTPTDSVAPETEEELNRLGAGSITIMGGPTAISEETEDALNDAGFETERVSGPTRIETAQDAAAQFFADADTAIVARAYGDEEDATRAFADSLAAGAAACEAGIPVLLTQTEELTETLSDYLAGSAIENVIVVGGRGAVSDETVGSIEELGISTERVSGSNRAATAVAVAEFFFPDAENATLIDGFQDNSWASGFPAALFASENDSPIVLVGGGSADEAGDDTDTEEGARLQEDGEQSGEEECVIPQETLDYLNSIFTENSIFTMGPFTDNCIEDLLAAEFGFEENEIPPTGVPTGPSASASPTATATSTIGPSTPVTDAPELVAVSIFDAASGVVLYQFDEDILGTANFAPSDFRLYRFNGQVANATAVRFEGSRAFAQFRPADVANATLGTVDDVAVRDVSGKANPVGAEPVQNVTPTPGLTDVPDLLSIGTPVTDAQGVQTVDFVFDEAIDTATLGVPGRFVLVGLDSVEYPGIATSLSSDRRTVTVTYSQQGSGNDIPFLQIRRGYVAAGTVCDADGCNPLQAEVVNNAARQDNTVNPDLLSARAVSGTRVEYTFDEAVDAFNLNATQFVIYGSQIQGSPTGNETVATSVERSTTDGRVVTATFPANTVPLAVGASVRFGAVQATDNTNNATAGRNNPDQVDLAINFVAGFTTLPDLVGVRIIQDPVTQNYTIRYTFDQAVTPGLFQPQDFRLYDASGQEFVNQKAPIQTPGDPNSVDILTGGTTANFNNAQAQGAVLAAVTDVSGQNCGPTVNGVTPPNGTCTGAFNPPAFPNYDRIPTRS